MRSIFFIILSIFYMNSLFSQDWANLGRYKAENEQLGEPKEGEKRVVLMGNSITEGWKQADPELFVSTGLINRGIGGQTSPQMLLRFRTDVIDLKPKVVVILAGTNDIAGNTGPMTLEETRGNIISMAELAKANGIKVIISSVLPAYDYSWKPGLEPNIKVPKLNEMLRIYAEKNGMIYLDYFSAMADHRNGLPKEFAEDGVHPTKEGYDVMKRLLLESTNSALK